MSSVSKILRRSLLAGLMLAPVAFSAQAQQAAAPEPKAQESKAMKYDFTASPAAGYTGVAAGTAYSATQGFGFEPTRTTTVTPTPTLFSVTVPDGNYKVTVELGGAAASNTTVKAESRRLMVEAAKTDAGQTARKTFIVNVRNSKLTPPPTNAPGFDSVATNDREVGSYTWDDKLTLEFAGPAPAVTRVDIEPVNVPTIYIAGDSTVTDQRSEPGASWGQMLTRFLKPEVAVANHAESGETLKSFITGRRLDKMLSTMKAGDYLFIQFGHNDSKANWPQTYAAADSTYRDYLKVFIGEARRRGATPVLLNPPQRRNFTQGKITNSHGAYPDAVRAVAKEMGVPIIDMTNNSIALYEALGPTDAPKAFAGNNGSDATHHNNYGAYQLARGVVEGIKAGVPTLAPLIVDDAKGPYDLSKPTPPAEFLIAPSAARSMETPRGS